MGMKDSGVEWIGEIPEGWDLIPIKKGVKHIGSGTTPENPDAFDNGTIAWVITSELRENVIESTTNHITEDALNSLSTLQIYPVGSLIIAMYGATIGRMGFLGVEACTNQACCVLSGEEYLQLKYIFYFLYALKDNLLMFSQGSGQPNLNQDVIRRLQIPAPLLSSQQKISAYLDRKCAQIDAILASIQQSIEKLKEYRQAVITQSVTKGLNPDAKMKDSGVKWIGEIPEGWRIYRLGNFLIRNDGGFWGNDPTGKNDVIVLRSTEQKMDGTLLLVEPALRNFDDSLPEDAFLRCGDLLITKSSGSTDHIGKTSLITGTIEKMKCTFSNFMQRLRLTSYLDPKLIVYMLNSDFVRCQFNYLSNTTSGLGNLNAYIIKNIKIALPNNLNDQQQISAYLDQKTAQIDSLISKKQKLHDKFTAYKKSLIYEYVTGKREVPNDSTE